MIDPTGGIGPQKPMAQIPKANLKPLNLDIDNEAGIADSFRSDSSGKSNYIILPPKGPRSLGGTGAIFKAGEHKLKAMNVKVEEKLPIIGGYVASLDDQKKDELAQAGYIVFEDKVEQWLPGDPVAKALADDGAGKADKADAPVELKERPKMDGPRFDTPLTRKYQGQGTTIAVIDSGLYPHPDFTTPENRILGFVDFVNGKKVPYDDNGHGTHVAGDAAGSGMMSEGLHKGMAPKANLIGLKALSGSGSGKTSDIIKAIQWCIQNKDKYNIRVINMSLGHTAQADYQHDPTDIAVKKAYEAGIVVVAAAGNEGPGPKTVAAPGDSPHAITVGAADDNNTVKDPSDDKVTDFSSRGPTPGGLMKPDILAPGEAIISTFSPGTESSSRRSNNLNQTLKWLWSMPDEALMRVPEENLKLYGFADTTIDRWFKSPKQARKEIARIFKAVQKTPIVDEAYVGMPGTSMASPIVAGVVAQMFSANPDLKPGQVSQILKMTADKLPGDVPKTDQGHGMVDPDEAIQKALDVKEGKLEIIPQKIKWPKTKKQDKKTDKSKA